MYSRMPLKVLKQKGTIISRACVNNGTGVHINVLPDSSMNDKFGTFGVRGERISPSASILLKTASKLSRFPSLPFCRESCMKAAICTRHRPGSGVVFLSPRLRWAQWGGQATSCVHYTGCMCGSQRGPQFSEKCTNGLDE